MNGTIRFPHLGITLEHVIRSVHVGGIEIACYGIVLAAAMVTGLLLAMKVAEKTGQDPEDYFDLGIIAIIVSVICARIYYVVFSWDYYREHLSEIWNIRQGGLAIYGGVIGGVLTVWLFCRVRKLRFCTVLDTAVPGLVWGQVVGRWGNFFNREAFGGYT
ncbi:MAG: prolipoprotein diacylglyceryl transferase, partial [Lachnospiraceae bacterium]